MASFIGYYHLANPYLRNSCQLWVSRPLIPIILTHHASQANKLSTVKKCLNEVLKYGGPFSPRDLYPVSQ